MTNKQLSIILRLKDEASKRLQGIRGNLQRFANSWKKNWLAITAAITASIMALRKAWDLMELGAKAEQQKQAFNNLATSLGVSADKMIQDLRRMSGETMSTAQIMEKASQAMILGIDPDKLSKMMEIARASARAFGKDVGFMFESIAIGVGRQSKLVLDNLGIIVSAGDAYEKYAKSIGKSAKDLTEHERKQAFLNATLEAGEKILKQIDTSTMTNLEKMQKLKAGWADFSMQVGQALWHVLGLFQGFLEQIYSGFFKLMEIGVVVFQKLLIPLQKFYDLLSKLPGNLGETYREASESIQRLSESMNINREAFELASMDSAQKAMEQYELVFAKVRDSGTKTTEVLKTVAGQVVKQAQNVNSSFNAMEEFAKQSARNMQNAFSQFFFQVFTGELKSVKDIFSEFSRAMLQMISNIIAKIMLIKMFSAMAGAGGSLFGIPIGQLFHSGGVVRKYHNGGIIRAHQGLAPDEVPIIAQTGEGILSRRGMRNIGGSDNLRALNKGETGTGTHVTVNVNQVIQAWDAQDVWRNRRTLSDAVAKDLETNGNFRKALRQYA
ncbi:hypothetical protein M0R36_04270 [bacterium]|nr:hypothetical protein [bacterium]